MDSDKAVTRIVASVLFVALTFCYLLISREAVIDISITGFYTPKGVVFTLALLVGTGVAIWAAYALMVDIITGGTAKPSK